MKLFVVTKGEYSDYRILAIFENKDDATEFIKPWLNSSSKYGPEIEEWETGTSSDGPFQVTYSTSLRADDGNLIERSSVIEQHPRDWSKSFCRSHTGFILDCWVSTQAIIGLSVISQDHADKIAAVGRQAMLREKRSSVITEFNK